MYDRKLVYVIHQLIFTQHQLYIQQHTFLTLEEMKNSTDRYLLVEDIVGMMLLITDDLAQGP